MADKITKIIEIDVQSQSLSQLNNLLNQIEQEIKDIQKAEKDLNLTDAERLANTQKLKSLEDQRSKALQERTKLESNSAENQKRIAKQTQENLENQQKRAESLLKATEGIAGAFTAAESASLLFGEETGEQLQQAQAKVQALIGLTQGIKSVSEGVANGYKLIGQQLQKANVSAKLFSTTARAALTATGIGVLVVGLSLAIEYFDELSQFGKELANDLGFTEIINQVKTFTDSIGGASGYFKILGAGVKAYFKEAVNYFQLLGSLVTFNKDEIIKNFKEIGDGVKGITKDIQKIQEDAAKASADRIKDIGLQTKQQLIDIQKAQGKETLELEEKLLQDRIEINRERLANEDATSNKLKELSDSINKDTVALLANQKAQNDKFFEDRLKAIQTNFNKQSTLLNDNRRNDLLSEEEYEEKKFQLQIATLQKEISLRKKHGEDVSNLELTLSDTLLNHQKEQADKKQAKLLSDLDKEYQIRVIALQDSFTTEQKYNEDLESLDREFLQRRIQLEAEGSKERLDLQKQYNDFIIKDKIEEQARIAEFNQYVIEQEKAKNQAILNDSSKSISQRKAANEELHNQEISNLEVQQRAYSENSLEYRKIQDAKKKADEDFNKNNKALNKEYVQGVISLTQLGLSALSSFADLLNAQNQKQLDEINQNISDIEERNSELQTKIDETNQRAEESTQRINELEQSLSTSRGERDAITKQQLEDERANRQKLLEQEQKLAAEKVKNENKVAAEKKKAAQLEEQIQKRQKAVAIANALVNATINGAVAITQAFGQLGPIAGAIAAVLVAATTAAQIATINAQKSFAVGGYTGDGDGQPIDETGHKVVGKVHANEYVVPRRVLKTSKGASLVNELESMRLKPFADGGYTTLPNFNKLQSNTTNTFIQDLSNQTFVVGVDEITRVGNKVKVIESSAGF